MNKNRTKEFEDEIIQHKKLQSVLELAEMIGHEMNQPLTGIAGYCALIKEEIDQDHPIYRDVVQIEKQARRLEDLVFEFQNIIHIENCKKSESLSIAGTEREK
ncbi:MAG: histidine kinase dimerization/phospho-acceptor domain-containing protein [bacterium]